MAFLYGSVSEDAENYHLWKNYSYQPIGTVFKNEVAIEFGFFPNNTIKINNLIYPKSKYSKNEVNSKKIETEDCRICRHGYHVEQGNYYETVFLGIPVEIDFRRGEIPRMHQIQPIQSKINIKTSNFGSEKNMKLRKPTTITGWTSPVSKLLQMKNDTAKNFQENFGGQFLGSLAAIPGQMFFDPLTGKLVNLIGGAALVALGAKKYSGRLQRELFAAGNRKVWDVVDFDFGSIKAISDKLLEWISALETGNVGAAFRNSFAPWDFFVNTARQIQSDWANRTPRLGAGSFAAAPRATATARTGQEPIHVF
jgi:hypothetical protein